jgi:hypothetical protein
MFSLAGLISRLVAMIVLFPTAAPVAPAHPTATTWKPLTAYHWQCGSHDYFVNATLAPAGAVTMIENAFGQVNAVTAPELTFRFGGTTDATTSQTDRIIVRWTSLRGGQYGEGAPQPWPTGPTFTGGYVEVNRAYPANQALALHEVGHVLNLAHVDEADEIMQPDFLNIRSLTTYGPGDRAGLSAQARGCVF